MSARADLATVLILLALHPVLPPADTLPPNDDRLRRLLADLALGARSCHAPALRLVAAEFALSVDELARRAEFLLACLVLPASGSHYEVLGVAPDASTAEIRKRWAALIQRYHPDRLGGTSGWLEGQARRLIEAYQTLKDPERRRAYDAERVRSYGTHPAGGNLARRPPAHALAQRTRWRRVPLGIAVVGVATGLWVITRPAPPPLPRVALPAAPKLLETWGQGEPSPTVAARAASATSGLSAPGPGPAPAVTAEALPPVPARPVPVLDCEVQEP